MKLIHRFAHQQQGIFSIISALTLTTLVALMGVVLTLGNTFVQKNQFQGAVDLAALSGGSSYRMHLMHGKARSEARTDAIKVAERILAYNIHSSVNANETDITYTADGDLKVSLSGAKPIIVSKTIGKDKDVIDFNVFANVNTAFASPDIDFRSIEALTAADNNQSIEPLLNGLQIKAYEEYIKTGKKVDQRVLNDKNILKNFDAQCKELRSIGYYEVKNPQRCSFFTSDQYIKNKYEVLEIGLDNNKNAFDKLSVTLTDIHVNKAQNRIEKVNFIIYTTNNVEIGQFSADAKGVVTNASPDLKITAQPLDDNYKEIDYNRAHTPNQEYGLLNLNIESTGKRPIKLVKIFPEDVSFQLVSVKASTVRSKPVRIVQ